MEDLMLKPFSESMLNYFKENIENIHDTKSFDKFQKQIQKEHKIVLSKVQMLSICKHLNIENECVRDMLIKKSVRSHSGVTVLTLFTSGTPEYTNSKGEKVKQNFTCKYDCFYCRDEPATSSNNYLKPGRSYSSTEPGVRRGQSNNYDCISQVYDRLSTLLLCNHDITKAEVIILGGSWNSYPEEYRDQFILDMYYGLNTFTENRGRSKMSLADEIRYNTFKSKVKCVGLSLETHPKDITLDTIKKYREYNVCRFQIGIQHLDDEILKKVNRKQTAELTEKALKLLKNNGFKCEGHIMLNLPNSTPDKDEEMLEEIVNNQKYQCDFLKIYPTSVMEYTKIKDWYDDGTYTPYSEDKLFEVILKFKSKCKPYVRNSRIIRDFIKEEVLAGYTMVHMRDVLGKEMAKRNLQCSCIRCMELKTEKIISSYFTVYHYKASDGLEYFLCYKNQNHKIIGYLRLRFPSKDAEQLDVLKDCAIIRELHIMGRVTAISSKVKTQSGQHRGYGQRLIEQAEIFAYMYGDYKKIAIISATGVRAYYMKFGYELKDTYMIKNL